MKRLLLLYLQLSVVVVILYSCAMAGFNFKHKTPRKLAKYPKFTLKDTLKGSLTNARKCYDVHFYELAVDINPSKKFLKGSVDIYFNIVSNTDSLQIDLFENMVIDTILLDGLSVKYSRVYDAVFIISTTKLQQGSQHKLNIQYNGKPIVAARPPWEGGMIWKTDKDKNPWIGVSCEVTGASLWWPNKDHLSDEPDSILCHFTVPLGLIAVSNGNLINRTISDNKETFTWKTSYPINIYNVTVYVGNFQHFSIPYKNNNSNFIMDFYVLPQNVEKAKKQFLQTNDIINVYESLYGQYPWPRDGYKLIESPYEGMEHQSAIAYGNKYRNNWLGYPIDYIILHETGHEWWGNCVSATDYAEIWLHEGFTTYSEALYIEKKYGFDKYLNYINFYAAFIKNKQPVIGPYGVNYWKYKDTDVYMKGALILHTLRNIINNDKLFFDILKTFYEENKYKTITTTQFIELVNKKTNNDFLWFFNQYLFNRACPILEYSYKFDANGLLLWYKWKNTNNNFKMPITIEIIFEAGNKKNISITPNTTVQTLSVSLARGFRINPNESYIALRQLKNKNPL